MFRFVWVFLFSLCALDSRITYRRPEKRPKYFRLHKCTSTYSHHEQRTVWAARSTWVRRWSDTLHTVNSSQQQISLLASNENEHKFIAIITLVIWVQLFLVTNSRARLPLLLLLPHWFFVHFDDDHDIADVADNPDNDLCCGFNYTVFVGRIHFIFYFFWSYRSRHI